MATLTNEQIEQKKQLLAEKMEEIKAIYDELVEAGAIELSENELDSVAGGGSQDSYDKLLEEHEKRLISYLESRRKRGR